jgi:hypothetical protein
MPSSDGAGREQRRKWNCHGKMPSAGRAATARGGNGGEVGAAEKQRWREVGCFLAHAAEVASEGFKSDAETWRDEAKKLKEVPAVFIVRQPSGSACHHSSQDTSRCLLETR